MFCSFIKNGKERKNIAFFWKERKRTQRTQCYFAKNVKERENVSFFCKRMQNVPFFFQYIYILVDIYRYIYPTLGIGFQKQFSTTCQVPLSSFKNVSTVMVQLKATRNTTKTQSFFSDIVPLDRFSWNSNNVRNLRKG